MLKQKSTLNIEEKIAQLIEENNQLKKEAAKQKEKMMMLEADEVVSKAVNINGLNTIILKMENVENVKAYAEALRNKCENAFVFIANINNDKVVYVCALSKAAIQAGYKAGDIVKMAAVKSNGNGGGKPDLAQSGGKDITKVDEVLADIRNLIK